MKRFHNISLYHLGKCQYISWTECNNVNQTWLIKSLRPLNCFMLRAGGQKWIEFKCTQALHCHPAKIAAYSDINSSLVQQLNWLKSRFLQPINHYQIIRKKMQHLPYCQKTSSHDNIHQIQYLSIHRLDASTVLFVDICRKRMLIQKWLMIRGKQEKTLARMYIFWRMYIVRTKAVKRQTRKEYNTSDVNSRNTLDWQAQYTCIHSR